MSWTLSHLWRIKPHCFHSVVAMVGGSTVGTPLELILNCKLMPLLLPPHCGLTLSWDTLLVDSIGLIPSLTLCCALMALLQILFSLLTFHVCCPFLIQLLAISHDLFEPQLAIRSDVAMAGEPPDGTP
jgi:hypothetical protein